MSVRVNLLPEATRQRSRAAHQRTIALAAVGVLLAGLGGTYWWASSQVRAAEAELAAEQQLTAERRTEVTALGEFADLADRRDDARLVLTEAMGSEVSLAGILQDVAAVMPTDTQLETLTIDVTAADAPSDVVDPLGLGTYNATGKTLTAHAPGVERVLHQLEKVVSFRDLYLNSSTLEESDERIATFSLDGRVGSEALTGRYTDGLPEELR
jgi:hypothetical protein